jgi:hypothetical protein
VHGFGFAGVLREIDLGAASGSVVMPLFSFNLGVELGQIGIAAIVLPTVSWLRPHPVFTQRCVPALSVIISVLGACWLVERTLMN